MSKSLTTPARRFALGALATAALAALTLAPIAPASASLPGQTNGGVRIMPLGDSITDGFGGYRTTLYQNLTAAGNVVDFVGLNNSGPAALPDTDHEGNSGWTSWQTSEYIARWLYATDPRTILLQLGTNDIQFGVTDATRDLEPLIDRILQVKPNVELFVASATPIDPVRYPDLASKIVTFNSRIPEIVARKGANVHYVNMYAALNPATDIGDGVHPNAAGYDKMAAVWTAQLTSHPAALQAFPAPVVPIGSTISIRAYNGLNVSAWQDPAETPLQARVDHVGSWERFQVVDAGNGFIGLKSIGNGKYVSTVDGVLLANSPHLAAWEMFRWVDLGNGDFGLASAANGNIVSARIGTGYTPLQAVAPHLLGWESFHWTLA